MTTAKKKVAALIGAGMVASIHVSACAAARNSVRLKGILSRSKESASVLASDASDVVDDEVITYGSILDVAADKELDFAIVVTPPNVRIDVIKPLIDAGKHILLEKPIARDMKQSKEIVDLCKNAGVSLGVVFQHRMRTASIAAINLIKTGKLGQLGIAEFRVPWWREQSYYDELGRGTYMRDGGGVLVSQAIHTIDLGLAMSGPVKSVRAIAKTTKFHSMESEDYVTVGIEFENGAVGSLIASTASFPGSAETITLHFEHATLHLEAGQLVVSWRDGRVDNYGEETGTGGGTDPMAFSYQWHQQVIENFVDNLNGGSNSFVSGEEALAAHEFIDITIRSSQNGTVEYFERR